MHRLVSFRGDLSCGKSTAAQYLVNKHGYQHIAFADALKIEAYQIIPRSWPFIERHGIILDEKQQRIVLPTQVWNDLRTMGPLEMPPTSNIEMIAFINAHKSALRSFLQFWGTDFRRKEDPEYFVRKALNKVRQAINNGGNVAMDDARFDNEIEPIIASGGIHIYIQSPSELCRSRMQQRDGMFNTGIRGHSSELNARVADPRNGFVIINDGTLDHLFGQIDACLQEPTARTHLSA